MMVLIIFSSFANPLQIGETQSWSMLPPETVNCDGGKWPMNNKVHTGGACGHFGGPSQTLNASPISPARREKARQAIVCTFVTILLVFRARVDARPFQSFHSPLEADKHRVAAI